MNSEGKRVTGRAAILGIALAGLAGCQTASRKTAYSDNPLLGSRQPLIHSAAERERMANAASAGGKPSLPPPVPLGPAPELSARAPAEVPPPPNWDAEPQSAGAPPVLAMSPALMPLPARAIADGPLLHDSGAPAPASAINLTPAAPSLAPRIIQGKYGHSSDRTWLQGELDRHYRGHLDLRYRPPSDEDTFGGKVRLDYDPRLADFRAGDVIAVEGEMVREADAANGVYPRFHIRAVRLVDRVP